MKMMRSLVQSVSVVFVLASSASAQPPAIIAADGTYLGVLSANPYDPDSVSNPYGRYGNPYSPDSINNPYGRYGNPYIPDSVRNRFATSVPPVIVPPSTMWPRPVVVPRTGGLDPSIILQVRPAQTESLSALMVGLAALTNTRTHASPPRVAPARSATPPAAATSPSPSQGNWMDAYIKGVTKR
jgi:hypothetical protein